MARRRPIARDERGVNPRCDPHDTDTISAVRLAAWRAAYGPLLPPGPLDRVDGLAWTARLRAQLAAGDASVLVAETSGIVQAFCSYGPCRDDDVAGADEIYAPPSRRCAMSALDQRHSPLLA